MGRGCGWRCCILVCLMIVVTVVDVLCVKVCLHWLIHTQQNNLKMAAVSSLVAVGGGGGGSNLGTYHLLVFPSMQSF